MTNTQRMVHLNLDLSPELNQILEELAKKLGGSKSDVLRQAIALMQIMVIAKEQTQSLGISEVEQLIASEIITPPKAAPTTHPLDKFIETFGAWEDERTPEAIIQDIYDSRTISNSDYSL
ncbi:ribbon-helix-helix protein, CopG family [Chlorogloeopsis sp. ULAP02]|uniref:ribbon-helix-helix protein, CopG family n=1 Tax=Chlorogloeopsis sp. ULAP02 TaxID=3107926 RepID=UPI0031370C4A